MNVEKLVSKFKNAIQKQDLSFDMCCYVYDQSTEDKYNITEVIKTDTALQIYYADDWGVEQCTIDDMWVNLCTVDDTLSVQFIERDTGIAKSCVMVDDCLETSIDFNVE